MSMCIKHCLVEFYFVLSYPIESIFEDRLHASCPQKEAWLLFAPNGGAPKPNQKTNERTSIGTHGFGVSPF